MNNKGQFSLIAALLVAVVLIGAVVTTYSAIRYGDVKDQPQILTVTDETNLAVREILGFTVGYYGSVLKVTGDQVYAQQLATKYLDSGLNNVDAVNPEWGVSINVTDLKLDANWFSNRSYSEGNATVTYDLKGLGMTGIHYFASTRLEVHILESNATSQARLTVYKDANEPLINLGKSNLKFYCYDYGSSTWNLTEPKNVVSYADGTYLVDLPQGVLSSNYVIQVEDNRGLMALAASYSKFTAALTWNSSFFRQEADYVNQANLNQTETYGSHGDFTAQQNGPDGLYDTLTEETTGTVTIDNYPAAWSPINSTSNVSGSIADLQSDDGACMHLRSYPVCFDSQSSAALTTQKNSLSWSHTTGAGNDRILLVAVDVFPSSGTPSVSVTYGGTALTRITYDVYSSNPRVNSYVYYLLNPAVGTRTVSVSFGSSTLAVGGAVTYFNIDQAAPIQSSTNTGSSANPSVSITSSGDKILFAHLGTRASSGQYTVVADGQNPRWSQIGSLYKGFGSEKAVVSGAVSASWTASTAVNWVALAVLLQPTQTPMTYACEAEFSGSSNMEIWNNIVWSIDGSATAAGVNVTYELYNYRTGQYVSAGDGYLTEILGVTDITKTQTITGGLTDFRDESGNWKIKVNATLTAAAPFDLRLDLTKYSVNQINYALNLDERWVNVNASILRQDLCIKTGGVNSSEPLVVQVWYNNSWNSVMTLVPNYFNNVSLAPYINSTTLKVRFVGGNDAADSRCSRWDIDCMYLKDEPDIRFLVNRQESTFTLEVLQNGTMRWLGENLLGTAQTIPVPPVPVKAIHVNQTIGGVNQEVPFQIEDWASHYQIPLGLSSNSTIFGNRQMIVFLLNSSITDFTVWWDGSDSAAQTPLAYVNHYFTYNPAGRTLNNGRMSLQFSATWFNLTSTVGGVSSSSTLMRINGRDDTSDPELSFVIPNGVVRDIVLGEAEYSGGGAAGCPNTYTNIVVTLPAKAAYYTYQLRVMFIDSAPRARTVTNLCPVRVSPSGLGSVQAQTEDSLMADFPIVKNGTGTFYNYTSGSWTAHHWSQLITDTGRGTGIMFTSDNNQKLYAFDGIAGGPTGALSANITDCRIELLPVGLASASFMDAHDITWYGAVATFDGTTPLCSLYEGTTPMGMWILAEYPPVLKVTASC